MQPKIGIVTVYYNSESVIEDFFFSLDKQTYRNFKLYVVDNNSTDNGVSLTRKLLENSNFETEIIQEKKNGGVARGNNIGIKRALEEKCDYILLANNDIVFNPDCVDSLLQSLKDNKADLIVPKILYFDSKKIWCAGGGFRYLSTSFHYGQGEDDKGQFDRSKYVEYAPTCFMLIKREVFDETGLMDEKYFVYSDDTDFIWRAVKNDGFKLYYEPTVTILHKVSSCAKGVGSNFGFHYKNRNMAYFMMKHYSRPHMYTALTYQITHYFLRTLKHPDFPKVNTLINYYKEGIRLFKEV